MLQSRQFTIHKGYRIYVPLDNDFRRDNHGCYLVHVQLSLLDGTIDERIGIPGCVAGSIPRALEMSAKYAASIVDERVGNPIDGAQGGLEGSGAAMEVEAAFGANAVRGTRGVSRRSPTLTPPPISVASTPDTAALREAAHLARQLMGAARKLPAIQREAAKHACIDALQALQASMLDSLNAAGESPVRPGRVR